MRDNMKANYAVMYMEGETHRDEGVEYAKQIEINDPEHKKFTKKEYQDNYARAPKSAHYKFRPSKKPSVDVGEVMVMSQ